MLSFDNVGTVICMEGGQWIRSIPAFEVVTYVRLSLIRRRALRLQLGELPLYITALVRQHLARPRLGLWPIRIYFFQSGCGRIRPLEVFGASQKEIKR